MAKWTKSKSNRLKDKMGAYSTKKQARAQAKMTAAQAKVLKSQAKANIINAKQSKTRETNKTLRTAAIASAIASPWNNIINNDDYTGNYQTGTISDTPTKEPNKNDFVPRG